MSIRRHTVQPFYIISPAESLKRSKTPNSVIRGKIEIDYERAVLPSQNGIFSEKLNELDILSMPR
jgi:hypothetical protein